MIVVTKDGISTHIKPQTIIWRPLFVYNGVMMPELHRDTSLILASETVDPMLKINLCGSGQSICEPTVAVNGHGMIAFAKSKMPEQWTHLTILRSCKNGKGFLVLPECLPDVDEYIAWRLRIAALYHQQEELTRDETAKQVAASSCPGMQANRKRIQLFHHGELELEVYND